MDEHYRQGFHEKNYKEVQEHQGVYQVAMETLAERLHTYLTSRRMSLKNFHLLDIGCFTGEFLVKMQQLGADVVGVELQKDAVTIANKKLGREAVISADIISDTLPWHNMHFDVITLLGLIEHVTDPLILLERVYSLLKPGGILMIQTPNSGTILARLMKKYWPPYTPIEHIHLFSGESIKRTLGQLGFKNIVVRSHVKRLTFSYVYGMLRTFGPGLRTIIAPFYRVMPSFIRNAYLPFYIGEIIIFARK